MEQQATTHGTPPDEEIQGRYPNLAGRLGPEAVREPMELADEAARRQVDRLADEYGFSSRDPGNPGDL